MVRQSDEGSKTYKHGISGDCIAFQCVNDPGAPTPKQIQQQTCINVGIATYIVVCIGGS